MKKSIFITLILTLTFCSLSVIAQEKQRSYWVTTDAGEQLEIFPNHTPLNPDAIKAPGSLTTLFASNNGSGQGGAVYFDLTVGSQDISITALDVNSMESGSITMDVYSLFGTSVGNETNIAVWGSPTTGSGVGAGTNSPSNIVLNAPINLLANTTYGIALVMDASHNHKYTDGNGTNQLYSNADLSLSLGKASNMPFSGSMGIFSPRVWNGTVYYTTGSPTVPLSSWAMILGVLLIGTFIVVRYRTRLA